jgi:hypothetical protein
MNWKVKRFTKDNFDNAERIERLYMSIVQPNCFELNNADANYLAVLDRAYPIIKSKPVEAEALQLIGHIEAGKWKAQVEQIFHDANRLYDSFNISKVQLKAIATRQLMIIAQDMTEAYEQNFKEEMSKAKAADVARRSWESVMKFNGLNKDETNGDVGKLEAPSIKLEMDDFYADAEDAEIVGPLRIID